MSHESKPKVGYVVYNTAPTTPVHASYHANAHATQKWRKMSTYERGLSRLRSDQPIEITAPLDLSEVVNIRRLKALVYAQSRSHAERRANQRLRGRPTSGNLYPFCETAAFFAFYIHDVGVALTAAPNAVLFLLVPGFPVLVFFFPLLLVLGCCLKIRRPRHLASWCVRWAMLNGCVPVAEVAEVMDVVDAEESAGCERVNRCVSPL